MLSTTYESPEFCQVLDGKRVILVGRANYMLEEPECEDQGEFIDSYDLVVRINYSLPESLDNRQSAGDAHFIPLEHQSLLGKRVSIFYSHLKNIPNPDTARDMVEAFKESGGFLICGAYPDDDPISKYPRRVWIDIVKERVSYKAMSYDFYSELRDEIRHMPFSGTRAMAELLKYPIEELRLIGFTFHHYLPSDEKGYEKHVLNRGMHSAVADFNWFKKQAASDSRIDPGKVLGMLMEK